MWAGPASRQLAPVPLALAQAGPGQSLPARPVPPAWVSPQGLWGGGEFTDPRVPDQRFPRTPVAHFSPGTFDACQKRVGCVLVPGPGGPGEAGGPGATCLLGSLVLP